MIIFLTLLFLVGTVTLFFWARGFRWLIVLLCPACYVALIWLAVEPADRLGNSTHAGLLILLCLVYSALMPCMLIYGLCLLIDLVPRRNDRKAKGISWDGTGPDPAKATTNLATNAPEGDLP